MGAVRLRAGIWAGAAALAVSAAQAGSGPHNATSADELRAACASSEHSSYCSGYLIAALDRARLGHVPDVCLPAVVDLAKLRNGLLDARVEGDPSALATIDAALVKLWPCR